MFEVVAITDTFDAINARKCRAFPLLRTVGAPPLPGDHICIRETTAGHVTNKRAFARVLHVQTLTGGALGPIHLLSIELVVPSDQLIALQNAPTPVPTGEL